MKSRLARDTRPASRTAPSASPASGVRQARATTAAGMTTGPQVASDTLDTSPRLAAQRRQIDGLFGRTAQRLKRGDGHGDDDSQSAKDGQDPEIEAEHVDGADRQDGADRSHDEAPGRGEADSSMGVFVDPETGLRMVIRGRDNVDGGRIELEHEGQTYLYYERENRYRTRAQAEAWEAFRAQHPDRSDELTGDAQADRQVVADLRVRYYKALELSMTPGGAGPRPAPMKPPVASKASNRPFGARVMTLDDLRRRDGRDADDGQAASISGGGSRQTVGGGMSGGSQTMTLQQPSPGPSTEQQQSAGQEASAEKPLHLVLRLRGASPAPELMQQPPNAVLVQAFLQELVHGNMWGGDAAAHQLADAFGVQFEIHHQDENGEYSVTVGSGGPLFHLLHHGNHYDVIDYSTGQARVIRIVGDGSCLFRACFRAVYGREPTADEIATMRELAASGMSEDEILAQIAALQAEAREGGLFGVGPGLRRLLLRRQAPALNASASTSSTASSSSADAAREATADTSPSPEMRRQQQLLALSRRGLLPSTPMRPIETPLLDSHASARADYERGLVEAFRQQAASSSRQASAQSESLPTPRTDAQASPPGPAMSSFLGARDEHRTRMQALLEAEGLKNAEKRRVAQEQARQQAEQARLQAEQQRLAASAASASHQQAEQIDDAQAADEADEPVFNLAGAMQVVQAIAPPSGQAAALYGHHNFDALASVGYMGTPQHIALLQQAIDAYRQAEEDALAARRDAFDPQDPGTWVMNSGGVQFTNGTSAGAVTTAREGAGLLASLARGQLNDRHNQPVIGQVNHQHLASGSWGIAFIYVLNADYTVTAWVVDMAYKRDGNKYIWETGGTSYVPSNAKLPKSHPHPKK